MSMFATMKQYAAEPAAEPYTWHASTDASRDELVHDLTALSDQDSVEPASPWAAKLFGGYDVETDNLAVAYRDGDVTVAADRPYDDLPATEQDIVDYLTA